MSTLTYVTSFSISTASVSYRPLRVAPVEPVRSATDSDSFALTERFPEQAYFWAEAWQEAEREADEDIREGRTKRFRNLDDAIAYLES